MATAGQMVAKAAEIFGIGLSTLEGIDRTLVVAGLRHKGGRGRSGVRVPVLSPGISLTAQPRIS